MAQGIVREWEAEGNRPPAPEPITTTGAWERFLADAQARRLTPATLYKYRLLLRRMDTFAQANGLRSLHDFDLPMLRRFLESRSDQKPGVVRDQGCLRAFFRFAHECNWIDHNPAARLPRPRPNRRPTMPFTPEQMEHILSACDEYGRRCKGYWGTEGIRAMVLLLRYSGLRISEALALERERVTGDKVLLYTAKAGTPVYVPLPDFVIAALAAVPKVSERYFFRPDGSRLETAIHAWQRTLKGVFRQAGIPDGHAYRFRETYVVGLLPAGVSIHHVSVSLGHSSIVVTERHFAPWVLARQSQLDAQVRQSWEPPSGGRPAAKSHRKPKKAA